MARKHTTGLILGLAVLAVVGLACSDDDPSGANSPMQQEHVSSSDCANEDAVARGEGRSERALSGDVDGDGDEDDVYIASDPQGVAGCRSFLVVDAGPTVYTTPVDPSGTPRTLETPTLNSLADLDGKGGPEVVVNIEMGASTQFVGVFALTRTGLERVTVDGRRPGPFHAEVEGLFAYGGSVGHLEAVDCLDGHVVLSAAIPSGPRGTYKVERRFFSPGETVIVIVGELTEKHIVRDLKIDDFPEFAGSPFLSCN